MQKEFIDEYTADQPEFPYYISKYISEQYIAEKVKDYCILRIGGIYGYMGPSHLFLNRAIDLAMRERKLFNIQNNGLGERNYIYVEDLCNWIIHIIQNRITGKHWVAGGEILSLKKIFNLLNDVFIDGQASVSLDDSEKGVSQVMGVKLPPITMHSYQAGFVDIKNKTHFS
jgi:nucleoside-diphosphate-sugar epimerase